MGMMNNNIYPFREISRNFHIKPDAIFVYQGDNYFDLPFTELFGDRIICIDSYITDREAVDRLKDLLFQTLINALHVSGIWSIADNKYLASAIKTLDGLNFFDDDFFTDK